MRVLDTVLRQLSRSERMGTLRQSATGQGDTVPSCDIKRIQGAALQLISDMEEKVAIPDRYPHATSCWLVVSCVAALIFLLSLLVKNKKNRIILFLSIVALGSLAVQSIDWLTLLTTVVCIAM